jgi:hypothetical protein
MIDADLVNPEDFARYLLRLPEIAQRRLKAHSKGDLAKFIAILIEHKRLELFLRVAPHIGKRLVSTVRDGVLLDAAFDSVLRVIELYGVYLVWCIEGLVSVPGNFSLEEVWRHGPCFLVRFTRRLVCGIISAIYLCSDILKAPRI